ncbi:MAG: prepilin-type N-terminal cleavage/methylation domain-containing protein, partial [Colwellia sp.]
MRINIRKPTKQNSVITKHAGFTLVELIVGIVVLSISFSI